MRSLQSPSLLSGWFSSVANYTQMMREYCIYLSQCATKLRLDFPPTLISACDPKDFVTLLHLFIFGFTKRYKPPAHTEKLSFDVQFFELI